MNIDMIIDKIVDAGLSGKIIQFETAKHLNTILYVGFDPVFAAYDETIETSCGTNIADAVAFVKRHSYKGLTFMPVGEGGMEWVPAIISGAPE